MADLIPVADPADPRVAPYLNVRDRDLGRRDGCFMVEGLVPVGVLLQQSRYRPESLLVAENRVGRIVELVDGADVKPPVHVAAQAVMDAIVGFHIHRGVLALARRGKPADATALIASLPRKALVVGLIGLANHDNVGGVFRNAAAFGADAVLLDATTCDPLYRKAIRVSVGGALRVPFARADDPATLIGMLQMAGFETLALSPSGGERLADIGAAERTAVLLGAEGPGLPGDALLRCRTVRIPMAAGFDSLNVATASGIALHHLAQARGPLAP